MSDLLDLIPGQNFIQDKLEISISWDRFKDSVLHIH